jgi:transposase
LAYAAGENVSALAQRMDTNRPKIQRTVRKALSLGIEAALEDLPARGKPAQISQEARAWLVSLACSKPKDYGYAAELWTMSQLAAHVRNHCKEAGHESLERISKGTVAKILKKHRIRPHKIRYYVERRDPEFDTKMIQVLHVYKEVEMLRQKEEASQVIVVSYDEKPGIQAIESTSPDLPPVPDEHPSITRDYEYIRHGTVTLMAAINLLTGEVYGQVVDRHRSREFVQFLKMLNDSVPKEAKVRIVLDNHSAHVSKETQTFLKTMPGRFEFIFTPKHGSWLNLIECFFSKMARTLLRGIRVKSKEELKKRIISWLEEVNRLPVPFRWKYRLEELEVA